MSILELSIKDLHNRIEGGDVRPSEVVNASLTRIQETNEQIGAFLYVNEEGARQRAKELDVLAGKGTQLGQRDSLFGVPGGIKDNICTVGMPTTCASKILAGYESPHNATVVAKLTEAGSVAVGKLNMDEFAMGSSTENSAYRLTHNPWNVDFVPGGSSGGSAAAVAAGQVPYTLGSDTGGSIRQPAAFCGIVGLKPTYGLVSRFGLVAFASSLDQIGPLTRTVEDTACVLQAIVGYDRYDSTSANVNIPNYGAALSGEVRGLRIGVPREYMGEGIQPGVAEAVRKALHVLESLGATVEEISLPHTAYAVATYYLLAPAEASSNLARYDGVRYGVRADTDDLIEMYRKTRSEGFGSEVKRRIMLGTYALSSGYYDAYYLRAQKTRTLIKQDFDQAFATYDAIVSPTAPTTAFRIGEQVDNPLTMYLNDICTIPVNLAGLPAISVPCGFADGLPVGLQVIGKGFDEATVLRVAHAYEQNSDAGKARPAL